MTFSTIPNYQAHSLKLALTGINPYFISGCQSWYLFSLSHLCLTNNLVNVFTKLCFEKDGCQMGHGPCHVWLFTLHWSSALSQDLYSGTNCSCCWIWSCSIMDHKVCISNQSKIIKLHYLIIKKITYTRPSNFGIINTTELTLFLQYS